MGNDGRREVWLLAETDQIVSGIHPASWCSGSCVVHAPSDHWMRDDKLGFDTKLKAFYRECKHGVQHHDPDERTFWMNKLESKQSLATMALEKLANFDCPNCVCTCCDLTARVKK